MYEIKPRVFSGAKLVTVFDGVDTQCYCICYHTLAKAIVLLKGSMDKAVFVRQYDKDDTEQFKARINKVQKYIDNNKEDIKNILTFVAAIKDAQAKEYMKMAMDRIENAIALSEEMNTQLV